MLSPYKFPKEIQEEAVKKAKRKRFLSFQHIKEQQPPHGCNFNESQNNLEDGLMVFGQSRDFEVTEQLQAFQNVLPTVPQSFYQLVKTLTLIKKFLQNTSNQIIRLPSFNQNMDLEKRYEHFPIKYWAMQPSEADPANEVVFTLDTQHVRCVLNITKKGVRGHVSKPIGISKHNKNPKMYLIIKDPVRDIAVLTKLFEEKNLNMFANGAASFYTDNGYHSVKHLAVENHTRYCMALHSTQMKFNFSQWNHFAERRDIILQFDSYERPSDNSLEVRVPPEGVKFVEITERCPFTLEANTMLRYRQTWRNFDLTICSSKDEMERNLKTKLRKSKMSKSPNAGKNQFPTPQPQKKQKVIPLEEAKAREQKYARILIEAKTCLELVEAEAKVKCQAEDDEQLKAEKWNDYLKCDLRPNANSPPAIRSYDAKLKCIDNRNAAESFSWMYSANVTCKTDLTRRILSKEQPQLDIQYDKIIGDYLEILKRIESFLRNNNETAKVKPEVLKDIIDLKNSLGAISEEHCFSGNNFRIHIWSLKNVPIRFTHLDEPRIMVKLHKISVLLHVPYSMLRPNLCIQAVHRDLDTLSEHAKSFRRKTFMSLENFIGGIQELPEYIIREYEIVTGIQNKMYNEIVDSYHDYEAQLFELISYLKSLGRESKNIEKILSKLQIPQHLADNERPDIYDEFVEKEQKQYETFLNIVYNPTSLNLCYDEINLRKFVILGGVYQINYVRQPLNIKIGNVGMIWHSDGRKLIVEKDLRVPTASFTSSVELRRKSPRIRFVDVGKSLNAAPPNDTEKTDVDPENPMFVLIFYLPDYLCYWGEPIACHFEEGQDDVDVETAEERTREEEATKLLKMFEDELEGVKLDKLNDLFSSSALRPPRPNYFEPSPSSSRIFNSMLLPKTSSALNIQDFPLDLSLTNDQMKLIQQFCVPQILSSYKLPKDIEEEKRDAKLQKMKRRKRNLFRSYRKEENHPDSPYTFDKSQNNPERIFKVFDEVEPFRVVNVLPSFDHVSHKRPKTFYQFVKVLLLIKNFAYDNFHGILHSKPSHSATGHVLQRTQTHRNLQLFEPSHLKRLHRFSTRRNSPPSGYSVDSSPVIANLDVSRRRRSTSFASYRKSLTNKINVGSDSSPCSSKKSVSTDRKSSPSKLTTNTDCLSEESCHKPENSETGTYSHWTTKHIKFSSLNREKKTLTIETDRLGFLGLAYSRYEHFPFKYWAVQPSETDPENEVTFILETQHVKCVLNITEQGICGYVSEPFEKYNADVKKYLVITDPIRSLAELKKRFDEKYLNIFAHRDACFYIEKGYFCVKHLATEMQTYCCIVLNSAQMKFHYSHWNRLAPRRDIILHFSKHEQPTEDSFQVRITPEGVTFVETSEGCSDNLNIIKLVYTTTWRNIDVNFYLYS
uniref:CASC1 C-terminal domain-containing protein n=1 Tax=Glossina austeni TaxID=7395 RepID=A0A1A9UGQ1_GLOAU